MPQGVNLLVNPGAETGDMTGWTITENGGDGWAISGSDREGTRSFITSYAMARRSQLIDLAAKGYSAQVMDQAPTINVSEWFQGTPDNSNDRFYLKVQLRDANQNVIAAYDSTERTASLDWQQLSHAFTNYGPGVRYIYWEDGGQDAEFWAGHYGVRLDDASLRIDLPAPSGPLELRVDLADAGTNPTGNWNIVPSEAMVSGLKDFNTGAATGISVKVDNIHTEVGSNQWFAGNVGWIDGNAGSDNFFGSNARPPLTARFAGFTPGNQYRIEVVSATNAGGVSSDVQVQGSFASRSSDGQGGLGDDWNGNLGLQRWLIWDSVTADANGQIVVTSAPGAGSTLSVLNDIRIVEVTNAAPTDLELSNTALMENQEPNTVVGTFSSTDPNTGDSFTYSLVAGQGDADNAAFVIDGNQLKIRNSADFETKWAYNLRVRTTDQNGLSFERPFTIEVGDDPSDNAPAGPLELRVDLADAGINPTGNWNTIPGAGTFSALKDFNTGTATEVSVTIENVQSEVGSNQWFAGNVDWIDGNAGSDNFFGPANNPLTARFNGLTAGKQYRIEVVSATNAGGVSSDVRVQGSFASRSSDGQGGLGDDWNGNLGLQRWLIWDSVTADANGQIVVTSAPGAGSPISVLNDIRIVEVTTPPNAAPTALNLSNTTLVENQPANTTVGTFSSTDPNTGDSFTYSLATGQGDADNAAFVIEGNQLKIRNSADFEVKPSYSIRVRTADQGGLSFERQFTVAITDDPSDNPPGNSAPTDLLLSNGSVNENLPANTVVGQLSSTDPNANNSFTYSLVAGQGDGDNSAFLIVGDQLQLRNPANFEAKPNLSIRVRTTDQGGLSFEKALAVTINNVNEAPTDLSLSSTSVVENVAANTVIGSFATVDPDTGNSFTYSLVAGTGSTDNSAFTIQNGQLRITASPDFEAKSSYSIRVRSTDQGGLTVEKPLTITVQDVSESFVEFVSAATADGLQGTLNRLQEVFNSQLLNANLPIVGRLGSAIPSFLTTLRDALVPAIRSGSNLTYDTLQQLLNNRLRSLFPGVEVIGSSNGDESGFEVRLSQQSQVTQVASDLGMPGLGLTVNGAGQGTLSSDLRLVFGSHRQHGFYIDTDRTSLSSRLNFGLSTLNGSGKMGLYRVRVTDDAGNRSQGEARFSARLNDIDAPGTNDGNRLTTAEIQRNTTNPALTTASLNSDPNLGLRISTDMGSAAIPGINTTLRGDIPNLTFVNGQLSGSVNSSFSFNNTELSLGSVANNVVLPTLRAIDRVISPMRPVINLLSYDLKSIGIGYVFPDVDRDGRVTVLDMLGATGSRAGSFLNSVKTLSDLSRRASASSNTGLQLGSFRVDGFNPFGPTNNIRSGNVVQTSSPLGIEAQLNQGGDSGSLIKDFRMLSGVKFNLFDSSTNAVRMLIGQPVDLFTYDMPELSISGSVSKEKTIVPYPLVLGVSGSIGASAKLSFGFDTFGLQQWADSNYASNQSGRVFNGFYVSDRANPNGTGADVDEFKLNLGIELSGGVGISFKPAVSITGGLYGELAGGPRFDLNDPNGDGKVRGDELFAGNPVNFSGVSVDAELGARVQGSLGPLSATLAQAVFVDAELFRYDARTNSFELAGIPVQDLTRLVRETTDRIYSGLRDIVARSAQIALEAARRAAQAVVNVGKKVVSGAKKVFRRLFNEPIAGADVFLDADFDGVQDANEPVAQTFSDGSFAMDVDMDLFDKNQNGILDGNEGRWIARGGYDVYTGLAQTTSFTAAADAFAINPLTTLVSEMMDQGMSQFEAQEQINAALGLPAGVDLGSFDPSTALAENDPLGAKLELAHSQMHNLLAQATSLLSGASQLSDRALNQQVLKAIAAQMQPGAQVSFSNAADVQKILAAAVANLQTVDANPKVQKLQAVVQQVAQVMAQGNQQLAEVVAKSSLKDLLRELGTVRRVTLGKLAEDLEAVGTGEKSLKEFMAENSGKAFDRLVAQAKQSLTKGTDGADMLRGSAKRDRLNAMAGDDRVFGALGADRLFGEADDDELFGEGGKDQLDGGAGNDILNGGDKRDRLMGSTGNDILAGGDAADLLIGGEGRDRFSLGLGEKGRDQILDFSQQDVLEIAGLADITSQAVGKAVGRKFFRAGKAKDANDFLLYDRKTGVLSFDADGNGALDPIKLVKLSSSFNLTASDLVVA